MADNEPAPGTGAAEAVSPEGTVDPQSDVPADTGDSSTVAPNAEEDAAEPEGLTRDEQEDLVEAEPESPPVRYSGQDFDVSGLVQRLNRDDILIPIFGHEDERISSAGFQRSFVWTRPQMDRFIESLRLSHQESAVRGRQGEASLQVRPLCQRSVEGHQPGACVEGPRLKSLTTP